MLSDKKTSKLMNYFLIIATLIFSGSYLLVVELPTEWLRLGLVAIFGVYCLYIGKISMKFLPTKYLIVYSVFFFLTLIVNYKTETFTGYVGTLLPLCFAYLVALIVPWDDFKKTYVNVMVVFTIIAVVMYYFGTDFVLKYGKPLQNIQSGKIYYSILVYSYVPATPRNCGFFWEPGLFSTALVYAIILLNQKALSVKSLIYNVILVFGIVSTKSTAGYVLIPIAYVYVFSTRLQRDNKYYKQILIALLVILFIGTLCFIFLDKIIYGLNLENVRVFQKLLRENLIKNPRVIAVQENLKYFTQYFAFGTGRAKGYELMKELDCYDTATAFVMLSRYGICGITYTVMMMHAIKNARNISAISKVLLFMLAFLLVNKEPNYSYVLSWALFFYMLNKEKMYNKKTERLCEITEIKQIEEQQQRD